MTVEGDIPTIDGYVADTPYPSNFHPAFQPEWTDWNLRRRSLRPPCAPDAAFRLVDLGCGDGLGLIATAASHPRAQFIGIDAMPEHIDRGRQVAAEMGLANITLHCADFAGALPLAGGDADYVTAQGVFAWISEANRDRLLDLAATWLKPGGAFTMGYNCLPGWGRVAGFQRLVRSVAQAAEGNSDERFAAAVDHLREAGIFPQALWDWFDPLRERTPAGYFAHEYLNAHWAPCWSGDVMTRLQARGLDFAGQATPTRLREDLCFKTEWRDALATMPDACSRELAADVLTDNWYRQDIYVKRPVTPAPPDALIDTLLDSWWILSASPEDCTFRTTTMAGELTFDNAAARALVSQLAHGPAPLRAVPDMTGADLVNAVDALYAARMVLPAAPPTGCDPAAFNRQQRAWGFPASAIATPHGAVGVDAATARDMSATDRQRLGL